MLLSDPPKARPEASGNNLPNLIWKEWNVSPQTRRESLFFTDSSVKLLPQGNFASAKSVTHLQPAKISDSESLMMKIFCLLDGFGLGYIYAVPLSLRSEEVLLARESIPKGRAINAEQKPSVSQLPRALVWYLTRANNLLLSTNF